MKITYPNSPPVEGWRVAPGWLMGEEIKKLKKALIVTVSLCLLFMTIISGCGPLQGSGTGGRQPDDSGKPADAGVVNVHNWGEYIDESIFEDFKRETGITVNYSTYETNEQLYALLRRGGTNVDVIIPSDYMVARLIEEDMLEKLDFSNIPNYGLIDDRYKNLEYDPSGDYSVAYMTGTVGLIYNSAMITDKVTSWDSLFNSNYAGQILMFDNSRDAFGIALMYLGYSQNTVNEDEIREAFDLLVQQKPFLQAYVMDQIFDKLESGEAWIGPYYAGDYLIMVENNPDLEFVRPKEGSNFFVDAMCIPKGAQNKTNAEIFIDFMTSTDIALRNMDVIMYASANFEAAEIFGEDMEPRDFEIMFASHETLAKCEVFTNLPREILDLYNDLWVELKK